MPKYFISKILRHPLVLFTPTKYGPHYILRKLLVLYTAEGGGRIKIDADVIYRFEEERKDRSVGRGCHLVCLVDHVATIWKSLGT